MPKRIGSLKAIFKQRDLLLKLIETKFEKTLPRELRVALDQVPAALLDSVGPLVLSAPTPQAPLKRLRDSWIKPVD